MGFNFYIGEFKVEVEYEDRSCRRVTEIANDVPGAPLNSSGHTNNFCYPGYGVWSNFCKEVGLEGVFYSGSRGNQHLPQYWTDDEGETHDGILSQHAGCVELSEGHYRAFVKAHTRWCDRSLAERERLGFEKTNTDPEPRDYVLARLDWLVFWTRWALDNCKYPSFANT